MKRLSALSLIMIILLTGCASTDSTYGNNSQTTVSITEPTTQADPAEGSKERLSEAMKNGAKQLSSGSQGHIDVKSGMITSLGHNKDYTVCTVTIADVVNDVIMLNDYTVSKEVFDTLKTEMEYTIKE